MLLATQIIAILFMATFIFIGIWSFIVFNKVYSQLKYRNYILEKIENRLSIIQDKDLNTILHRDTDEILSQENLDETLEALDNTEKGNLDSKEAN